MNEEKKPLILIIEDDPLIVKMYKTKFASEGFEVVSAGDGLMGLKLATEKRPDVILLDIMMPKLSGIDTLKKLRADPTLASTPVVVLSNLSQEEEMRAAKQLGAKEYLVKANFTPQEVVQKVKVYI